MDQLGGVDFAKGCYVGQEVVSRMEHRGIARTRAVPVRYDGAAPAAGAAVTAGDTSARHHGLRRRRPRRGAAAARPCRRGNRAGEHLAAGGVPIRLVKPDWARFAFPDETKAAE